MLNFIKNWTLTVILAVVLAILSFLSLVVGVIAIQLSALLAGVLEQLEIFLISRLPDFLLASFRPLFHIIFQRVLIQYPQCF